VFAAVQNMFDEEYFVGSLPPGRASAPFSLGQSRFRPLIRRPAPATLPAGIELTLRCVEPRLCLETSIKLAPCSEASVNHCLTDVPERADLMPVPGQ
jgi:hypothetical protein